MRGSVYNGFSIPEGREDFLRDGLVRIFPDGVPCFDRFEQCHI